MALMNVSSFLKAQYLRLDIFLRSALGVHVGAAP
jgi:hypothetical protein